MASPLGRRGVAPSGVLFGFCHPVEKTVLVCVLLLSLFYVCSKFIWRKRVLFTRFPKLSAFEHLRVGARGAFLCCLCREDIKVAKPSGKWM